MKPTVQINHRSSRQRDEFASSRKGAVAPKIEYLFQAPSAEFSGHRPGDRRSFRHISDDYFAREARGHFKGEALFFGLIVVTVAVPLIEGIRGLFQVMNGLL